MPSVGFLMSKSPSSQVLNTAKMETSLPIREKLKMIKYLATGQKMVTLRTDEGVEFSASAVNKRSAIALAISTKFPAPTFPDPQS